MRKRSSTDTFVAARLWIDNNRWRGVPFLLRTGKRLAQSHQRVSLILREPTGTLSGLPKSGNVLSFELKGDGAIGLRLVAKQPGPELALRAAETVLPLDGVDGAEPLPPYVRLIHDVLLGDRSLFTRPDGLAAVWDVAEPLLAEPAAHPPLRTGLVGTEGGRRPRRARRVVARRLSPWRDGTIAVVLRWITAGESHGVALVAVLDGLPAGVEVTTADVGRDLARRRLGYGRGARMKFEQDEVELTGGVRHGLTMGGPGRDPRRQHRVAEVDDGDGRPTRSTRTCSPRRRATRRSPVRVPGTRTSSACRSTTSTTRARCSSGRARARRPRAWRWPLSRRPSCARRSASRSSAMSWESAR